MANIKVTIDYTLLNGQPLTFKSPTDCSQVTGLTVCYPEDGTTKTKTFQFADAHGNNVGSIDLFASNVLVKVILDVEASKAYVQNADTNAYLEAKFDTKAPAGKGYGDAPVGIHAASADETLEVFSAKIDAAMASMPNGTAMQVVVTPPETYWYGSHICTLYKANSDNACLMSNGAYIAWGFRMQKKYGAWQPLEHINPPMELGREYRTTERRNGKPVYYYYANLGIAPETGFTAVSNIPVYNVAMVYEAIPNLSTGSTLPVITGSASAYNKYGIVQAYPSGSSNRLTAVMERATNTTDNVYVLFKYSKTTD